MKKQFLKLSVLGGVLFSALVMSVNANAACYQSNQKVERVLSYGTYGYIYTRPINVNLTSTYYNYIYTASDKILATASAAKANNSIVHVYGNVATCPTNTGGRYLGTATYINDAD